MIESPGNSVRFRLVDVSDAEFILRLRLSPRGRFLSATEDSLPKQEEWIRKYKQREAAGEEHYFVINHRTGGDVGTFRVYEIEGTSFTWGSWILDERAPRETALDSTVLLFEWCFFRMHFTRGRGVVRKNNHASLDFHRRFGARITGEDELSVFFEVTRDDYGRIRQGLELQGAIDSPV